MGSINALLVLYVDCISEREKNCKCLPMFYVCVDVLCDVSWLKRTL